MGGKLMSASTEKLGNAAYNVPYSNPFRNYYNAIPNNWWNESLKGAGIAFVIATVASGHPLPGLICAALSATATIIYALVTPLFKLALGENRNLTWMEEMIRGGVSMGLLAA